MPMVRMSRFMASRATMGAAPVPVPPPMPAVMNTILMLSSKASWIFDKWVSASRFPTSGRPTGTESFAELHVVGHGRVLQRLASVLHTKKRTPSMRSRYMLPTALPPPPPTPITLMMEAEEGAFSFSGKVDEFVRHR